MCSKVPAVPALNPLPWAVDHGHRSAGSDRGGWVEWNAEVLTCDLRRAVERLKQEPARGLYTGGVQLPLASTGFGLIDRWLRSAPGG